MAFYELESHDSVRQVAFKLKPNTDRTLIVEWDWNNILGKEMIAKDRLDYYLVQLRYKTKNMTATTSTSFAGTVEEQTTDKYIEITVPDEDATVAIINITPISKLNYTDDNGVEHYYFKCADTTDSDWTWTFVDPPAAPSGVPTVSIDKLKLTATLPNLSYTQTPKPQIIFQVARNNLEVYKESKSPRSIWVGTASETFDISADATYKVRACAYDVNTQLRSEWTEYSSEVLARPTTPIITAIDVINDESVRVRWEKVNSAKKYQIQVISKDHVKDFTYKTLTYLFEYTNVPKVVDTTFEIVTSDKDDYVEYYLYNLIGQSNNNSEEGTSGEYYIRILANNGSTEVSEGSETMERSLKSFIIGTKPTAPTTWSSTNTVVAGEPLKLYWLHNSEDNSYLTGSKLVIIDNDGGQKYEYNIGSSAYNNDFALISYSAYNPEENKVREVSVKTERFTSGSSISWYVSTKGAKPDTYSEPSITREIDIYNQPSLYAEIMNKNLNKVYVVDSFPFNIYATMQGEYNNQSPIAYQVEIKANTNYETTDTLGNSVYISSGTVIYSKYFDTNQSYGDNVQFIDRNNEFVLTLLPQDIDLKNNGSYTVTVTVVMSSGLTATDKSVFSVGWSDYIELVPTAIISVNRSDYSATIIPYALTPEGNEVEDFSDYRFSVYRKDFNGAFTEIGTNMYPYTNVDDPHPALDYARYRIVLQLLSTGAITYVDISEVSVGGYGFVFQWENNFLELIYNLKVDDTFTKETNIVNYIGRERGVSYYGTHKEHTSNWSTEIPKTDVTTLTMIRKLAEYMGDVYIREPSGTGYWANVSIGTSISYDSLVVPIAISVVRVEGGK